MRQNEIAKASVGDDAVKKMCVGETQVWPATYDCVVLAVPVTDSVNYTMSTIPAAGGQATVQYWAIISQSGSELARYRLSSQYVQIQFEEEINGQWVTPQNFTNVYDSANTRWVWRANDRGNNGVREGYAPQSAPARRSRVKATYSGTYQNVSVGGETQWIVMTQNANNAVAGTPIYDVNVYLDDYDSSSDAAPAYESYTRVTAYADLNTPYTFVDGVTGATVANYTYIQPEYVKTDGFNLSSESWVSFGNKTTTGADVTVASRGTDTDLQGRYATITATLASDSSVYGETTIYQAKNERHTTAHDYDTYDFYLSESSISSSGATISFWGFANYNDSYEWDSLATGKGTSREREDPPSVEETSVPIGVSVVIDYTNNTITIPANQTPEKRDFRFTGTYNGKSDYYDVSQSGESYRYAMPVITGYEYVKVYGTNYNIPASGNIGDPVYPAFSFSQTYGRDGESSGAGIITGSVSGGDESGTAYDEHGYEYSYSIKYYVNNSRVYNGGAVTAGSRGTTPDSSSTPVPIASNCYAIIEINSVSSTSSPTKVSVTQQANRPDEEVQQRYTISGLAIEWDSGRQAALSAGEQGTMSCSSCKEYYKIQYTSGEVGTTEYNRNISPDYYSYGSWSPSVSGDTVTATKRGKNDDSQRSSTIYAAYNGTDIGSITIYQAGTSKSYSLTSNYDGGISFTAAGGSVTPSFTGSTDYDNGDNSDITPNASVTFSSGSDVSGRITRNGTTIKGTYLGTTPYSTVASTTYVFYWTDHSSATTSIDVTQGINEPGNYGTITISLSSTSIPASGKTVTVNSISCPFTWTSGAPDSLTTGYTLSWRTKANEGKRTYEISGNSLIFGSLGVNRVDSALNSFVNASHPDAGTAYVGLQEGQNVPTSDHLFSVNWSNPVTLPGYGGSINVGVVTASYKTKYTSGEWDDGVSLTPSTVAASIQISGDSGFTKSYTSGTSYVQISAAHNPDSSYSRECEITAYYQGQSASTTVTQPKCPFSVTYVDSTSGGQRIRTAYIYNTDSERHRYGYTKETAIAGEVETTTGTAGPISAGSFQNMGSVPLVSGQTNTISVVVDTIEYYSGGTWVSHNVI